jgi:hypothetical protein
MKPDLFEQVARHLAGRPVEVRQEGTSMNGADGQAIKEHGQAMIRLPPWQDDRRLLRSFCHEVGHVKLHFDQMVDIVDLHPLDRQLNEPGAMTMDEEFIKEHDSDPQEQEAERFANEMVNYANHYSYLYEGRTLLEKSLNCLLEWPAKEH